MLAIDTFAPCMLPILQCSWRFSKKHWVVGNLFLSFFLTKTQCAHCVRNDNLQNVIACTQDSRARGCQHSSDMSFIEVGVTLQSVFFDGVVLFRKCQAALGYTQPSRHSSRLKYTQGNFYQFSWHGSGLHGSRGSCPMSGAICR